MLVKLSKTSKLDGILSWSLQALETCPGAKGAAACEACYALDGNYRFANVKAPREHNKEDWKRKMWVLDMVHALEDLEYFRWFDSGDMYAIGLARKIYAVMLRTPYTKHWLPTRMHKFEKFGTLLALMEALPNVVVRRSSDSITGETIPGRNTSTIVQHKEDAPEGAVPCLAYEHGGKCSGCRACWSKDVPIVAYVGHGRKIVRMYNA